MEQCRALSPQRAYLQVRCVLTRDHDGAHQAHDGIARSDWKSYDHRPAREGMRQLAAALFHVCRAVGPPITRMIEFHPKLHPAESCLWCATVIKERAAAVTWWAWHDAASPRADAEREGTT